MGANCAFSGYLTATMKSAGCDVTICDEIIELYGDEIADGSNTDIFCGYRYYDNPNKPIPTGTPTLQPVNDTIPVYGWVLIALGIVLVAIIAGLTYKFVGKK